MTVAVSNSDTNRITMATSAVAANLSAVRAKIADAVAKSAWKQQVDALPRPLAVSAAWCCR